MSTITEAAAHMQQLIDQGCSYEVAVHDTQVAFELDDESMDFVTEIYEDELWAEIRAEESWEAQDEEFEYEYNPLNF